MFQFVVWFHPFLYRSSWVWVFGLPPQRFLFRRARFDTDKCGAVVNYKSPSGCGKVSCDHASGSFFGVGETSVTCTSSAGPTCTFKVTVKDTQVPVITIGAQPVTLWPPNHNYKTIKVTDLVKSVSDNCRTRLGIANGATTG